MTTELQELQQQKAELARQARILRILQRVQFNGKVLKDCAANEQFILELPPQLSPEEISEAFAANPKLAESFLWILPPASKTDPKQLEKDRQILETAAKANGNFSGISEANLSLARSVLGPGFSETDLIQAFTSRRIVLAAPSDDEKLAWEQERIDAENLRLQLADTRTLRQETRDGYTDRRQAAQAAEATRVFEEKEKADQGIYPPLPSHFRGRTLDREFFVKHCDRATMKFLNQKFGPANVEARIRGIR